MEPKDQVKEVLSITDVVSTYIRLEKSGNQFRARCPFHNERTPSFYVSPERRSFHCFGCQEHGDIFTFVEKIENIPFYDALKILADRAGVSLKDSQRNKEDSRLIALLKDATEYFEKKLEDSAEAREYLMSRGLSQETLKMFHVGYAKNEWRDVFTFLASKGYTPEEMEQAGLAIKTEKGFYDRFRGRIMFPIRNVSGATVGYSGRILPSLVDPTVAQGKYVNTPETPLYHKSKILFGYDTAKKTMNETKEVVVVEGQMDLCMSYQAGVHNTVAVSGTAFTDEHIHLIKRFCDKVILSFDTDSAGQNALKKTALLCLLGGLDVYVVGDIGTKDPADLIMENPALWLTAIKNKKHVVESTLDHLMEKEKDDRERGRKIVLEVLPLVRAIQSSIDKAHFIKLIAKKSGLTQESLQEELVRGIVMYPDDEEVVSRPTVHVLEKFSRDLLAFAKLYNKEKEIKFLNIDTSMFPDAIIEETMFKLEEELLGDKEQYFHDLIARYQDERKKDQLKNLQAKLREEGSDHEKIMKEMHELTKSFKNKEK
ncbi:MAG: primase [Patescibacteria group bacterium]|nr:primase [Patescibacteria group bacterium]